MESNNQFLQEVPSESPAITASAPDNSTDEELSDLELDAIAGGCSDMADRARAAGIPVITASGPRPNIFGRGLPMNLIEEMQSYYGQQK
ncbi:hypothetical protein QUA41_18905 [Microcoleus sp. Pol11C1]|uniref:hypothetical protein n=1 Tax=unclassified Microcoleus TaxID=2642155 RepID=UPI002FD71D34